MGHFKLAGIFFPSRQDDKMIYLTQLSFIALRLDLHRKLNTVQLRNKN